MNYNLWFVQIWEYAFFSRSITLHYRIREDSNPHSKKIKAFDEKIERKLKEMSEPSSEAAEKEIEEKEIEE